MLGNSINQVSNLSLSESLEPVDDAQIRRMYVASRYANTLFTDKTTQDSSSEVNNKRYFVEIHKEPELQFIIARVMSIVLDVCPIAIYEDQHDGGQTTHRYLSLHAKSLPKLEKTDGRRAIDLYLAWALFGHTDVDDFFEIDEHTNEMKNFSNGRFFDLESPALMMALGPENIYGNDFISDDSYFASRLHAKTNIILSEISWDKKIIESTINQVKNFIEFLESEVGIQLCENVLKQSRLLEIAPNFDIQKIRKAYIQRASAVEAKLKEASRKRFS